MAPAVSRIAPGEGDAYRQRPEGPHWTTRLPHSYRELWSLSLPVTPLPPEYDTECTTSTESYSPPLPPAQVVSLRRLTRSAWHPDLSSESGGQAPVPQQGHQVYQSLPPPESQDPQPQRQQQQPRAQNHTPRLYNPSQPYQPQNALHLHHSHSHPHSCHLQHSGHDHQAAPQVSQQSQQQLHINSHLNTHPLEHSVPQTQPVPHSPQSVHHSTQSASSAPLSYTIHPALQDTLYQWTKQTVEVIADNLQGRGQALALEGPTESAIEELESVGAQYDQELDFVFEGQGDVEGDVSYETQEAINWMINEPIHWPLDQSLESAIKESLDEMFSKAAEAITNPAKPSCISPLLSPPPLPPADDVKETAAVEPPAELPKRVRFHKNQHARKKQRLRQLEKMARQPSNNPEPASGSPGDATPFSIADTIIGSDNEVVRSPSPSSSRLPLPTEGMQVAPSAPAVPEAPPKKKKKKKKKGKIQAEMAGDNFPGVSSDAQVMASTTPAEEPSVSLVGATAEAEIPARVTTGQDRSPKASEDPPPAVVDGVEATGESFAPKQEYVGPCIVDTEKWRQRMLARQAAEEEASASDLAVTSRVGDVSLHSLEQSENSWAQWPMEGQSVPAQYSHDGGHQTGYEQPGFGVVAGPQYGRTCGFLPACYHHNGNPRCSCCCFHSPAHCWFASENHFPRPSNLFVPALPPPDAGQELAPAVASLFEAFRTAKMSPSPKSSSLGEPVSEPIVESVESLSVRSSASASANEPAVVSSMANIDTTLDESTIQETTPANNSLMMSLRQAQPGEVLTPEDLKSPSLYFDAKSKNLSSSPLASSESKEASQASSRKPSTTASKIPEEKSPSMSAEDILETRNQDCLTTHADAREPPRHPEATRPLAMAEHVQALFGNPVFTDVQLLLSPSQAHPPIVYHLHKAILAGSPFLCDVMMTANGCYYGGVTQVRAFTGTSFMCSHAFTMALQVLYGTPLVTNETLRKSTLKGLGHPDDNGTGTYSFSIERAMVDFALCYAAAGAFLARREITERGIDMAMSHISWETAEFILSFAMTPIDYMVTCPDVPFTPISPASSRASSFSAGHSNDSPVIGLDHFHDFHYVQAQRAQTAALNFITAAVKPDFELYRRAQAHYTPSRVPPALHTLPGSMLSNPRLEDIQFGSFPSFADLRPKDPAILVPSAMLITLPYRVFLAALDIMQACGNLTPELLKEVVEERESRRLHALRISLRVDHGKIPQMAFAELLYHEYVTEPSELADQNEGVLPPIVDRVWAGYEFPNKSALRPKTRHVPSNASGPPPAGNASPRVSESEVS